MRLLRRRAGLILLVFFGAVLAAGTTLIFLTPLYSATALVYVDPERQGLVETGATPVISASENARIDSEAEILRSDAVLLDVIAALDLASDPEFAARPRLFDQALELVGLADDRPWSAERISRGVLDRLREAIAITRRGLTFLIAVEARSHDPARAAEVANAIVVAYLDRQLAAKIANIEAAQAVIDARLAEAAGTDGADARIEELLSRSEALALEADLQIPHSRVISPALEPARPVWPNIRLTLIIVGLAGLGLGAGLAFATERMTEG